MLRADYEALVRGKTQAMDGLEREVSELQCKLADTLAEKTSLQHSLRGLEHDKCQLCVQVSPF